MALRSSSAIRPSTIHMFDFSKTGSYVHFKLGGDVTWVGFYQVCSNGYGPVIFGFFMIFWGFIFGENLKKSSAPKSLGQLL